MRKNVLIKITCLAAVLILLSGCGYVKRKLSSLKKTPSAPAQTPSLNINAEAQRLYNEAREIFDAANQFYVYEENIKKVKEMLERCVNDYPEAKIAPRAQNLLGFVLYNEIVNKNAEKKAYFERIFIDMDRHQKYEAIRGELIPYDEAVNAYEKTFRDYPATPEAQDALFTIAKFYQEELNPSYDLRKSIYYFELLIKEYPKTYYLDFAYYYLGNLYRLLKEREEAVYYYEKLKEQFPEFQFIYLIEPYLKNE